MKPLDTKNTKIRSEIKVGIFVACGIGLLMAAILLMGGADSVFVRKFQYSTLIPDVNGLLPGAKVQLSGMTIGSVSSTEVDYKTRQVRVFISVGTRFQHWIREDSFATLETQGVLGDKYIALSIGTSNDPLVPGSEIPFHPSQTLTQVLGKGDELMIVARNMLVTLEKILQNFEMNRRSDVFFQGMSTTAKNLSSLSEKLDKQISDHQLKSIITSLDQILTKINNGTGTAGALINDRTLYEDARTLVGRANRSRVMRNLVRQTIQEGAQEDGKKK